MAERLSVDSDAIHMLAQQVRSASDVMDDSPVHDAPEEAFESPVAEQLRVATTDVRRQAAALQQLTSSLAQAGDRAADEFIATDGSLAGSAR